MMGKPIAVLIAGYEAAPFYKKGGLGEVIGTLPTSLRSIGVDARVVLPFYHQIKKHFPQKKIGTMLIHFGNEDRLIKIYQGVFPETKTPIYFLENQRYINLAVSKVKKLEEFVFFDLAVCYFINWLSQRMMWQVQVVHCNDWHTGLIPLILQKKLHSSLPTLLTIHNLLYQGSGSSRVLELLDISDVDTRAIKRNSAVTEMNILGEGILHASAISTVSPTYAEEISHAHKKNVIYSYLQLREKERGRNGKVIGILNGIDTTIWNPAKGIDLFASYTRQTVVSGKEKNKQKLLGMLRLPNRPTYIFIGRLDAQKGLDTLTEAAEKLDSMQINCIILGTGHHAIEQKVRAIAQRFPDSFRAEIEYSENIARQMHAGADFLLMPSHYEPCGLVQLAAMAYGTIPVASRTGGLIDTIQDGSTGFLFEPGSTKELITSVGKSLKVYENKKAFEAMRDRCMLQDFSWDKSAKQYKNLYEALLTSESGKD